MDIYIHLFIYSSYISISKNDIENIYRLTSTRSNLQVSSVSSVGEGARTSVFTFLAAEPPAAPLQPRFVTATFGSITIGCLDDWRGVFHGILEVFYGILGVFDGSLGSFGEEKNRFFPWGFSSFFPWRCSNFSWGFGILGCFFFSIAFWMVNKNMVNKMYRYFENMFFLIWEVSEGFEGLRISSLM